MLVPDEVRKSVVFVCYKSEGQEKFSYAGTAFFISVKEPGYAFMYVVTAKHVIIGIKQNSNDGKVYLRMNKRDGDSEYVGFDIDSWEEHPSDTSVDAMVLPCVWLIEKYDYLTIPSEMVATDKVIKIKSIGVGDEIFFTGLFVNHVGKKRILPILRIGNISLMPEEKIQTKKLGSIEAYLVEARSIGGLSGSPVFVHLSGVRTIGTTATIEKSQYYLLGLMHGHWELDIGENRDKDDTFTEDFTKQEAVNMGIAIVIPVNKIMEIINKDKIRAIRKKFKQIEKE